MLFLVGAKKVGAIGVPEGGVMEDAAGNGLAVGVDEFGRVGKDPTVEIDSPVDVGRLRHFHVAGVGGKTHGAFAENDSASGKVEPGVERDAFGNDVMHAALHEAAVVGVLHMLHIVGWRGGRFFLCASSAGSHCDQKRCGYESSAAKRWRSMDHDGTSCGEAIEK